MLVRRFIIFVGGIVICKVGEVFLLFIYLFLGVFIVFDYFERGVVFFGVIVSGEGLRIRNSCRFLYRGYVRWFLFGICLKRLFVLE